MIPLVSTMCQGPAGVAQLPRFWWKVTLHQAGRLDEAYPFCSRQLDSFVLEILGLDGEETIEWLREEQPDYLAFEERVAERAEAAFPSPATERWNKSLERRTHFAPSKIRETYQDIGFDETATVVSAVTLNCLQDWQLFYRNDFQTGKLEAPVVPLISSLDQGPMGVCQLPRTWLKVCLEAKGWLHPDYPACGGGLDSGVFEALGVDKSRAVDYLKEELPDYLTFEAWILKETEWRVDRTAVEAFHRRLREREHPEAKRASIHTVLDREQTWTSGVLLNHLEDWKIAHQVLTGK